MGGSAVHDRPDGLAWAGLGPLTVEKKGLKKGSVIH